MTRDSDSTDKDNADNDSATDGNAAASEPPVLVERADEGRIYILTLNRPHRLNAIGGGLMEALYAAFEEFRDDPDGRVAILRGAGRAFCAGVDLKESADRMDAIERGEISGPLIQARTQSVSPLSERLGLWKPTIAAIHGYAIAGGFMLAMQCDIRIAADDARIGIAEARWNRKGGGWMAPLTRQIGLGNALQLVLWGDTQWSAARAREAGWVQEVVPRDQLMDTAMEWARRAVDMAPRAVRNLKQALYRGYYMDPLVVNEFGVAIEQNLDDMQDTAEGARAFAEKRRPNFRDE